MNRPEITFSKSLKEYGIFRFLKSIGFYLTLLVTIGYWYFEIYELRNVVDRANFASTLANTSAALFSILFAAFAIIVALSDKDFILLLRKTGKLNNILFPFWLISFLYILSIFTNLLAVISKDYLEEIAATAGIFFFVFALTETLYLVSTTVKFGLYRSEILGALADLHEIQASKKREEEKLDK